MISEAPVLALDVGTRKVGLAQSLPLGIGARPVGVFSSDDIWVELERRIIGPHGVETVVLGWPLREDGNKSALCDLVESFERTLRQRWPHLNLVRVDERYSSAEARDRVQNRGGSKRTTRTRLDDEAACILLEDYLRGDTGEH